MVNNEDLMGMRVIFPSQNTDLLKIFQFYFTHNNYHKIIHDYIQSTDSEKKKRDSRYHLYVRYTNIKYHYDMRKSNKTPLVLNNQVSGSPRNLLLQYKRRKGDVHELGFGIELPNTREFQRSHSADQMSQLKNKIQSE